MDDVLKERCEQLKAMHQADVDCLKDEHKKNLKNLAQEFKDKVYNVSVLTVFIFQLSVFSLIVY